MKFITRSKWENLYCSANFPLTSIQNLIHKIFHQKYKINFDYDDDIDNKIFTSN